MLLKRLMVLGLLIASASTVTFSATSTSTCVTLTKNLSRTSSDAEVLNLQQFLFDSGYLKIKPSGLFSSITASAVKSFQLANGISPVGTVGPKTRAKIKEVSCKAASAGIATSQILVQASTTFAITWDFNSDKAFILKYEDFRINENPNAFFRILLPESSSKKIKKVELINTTDCIEKGNSRTTLFDTTKENNYSIYTRGIGLDISAYNIQYWGHGGFYFVSITYNDGTTIVSNKAIYPQLHKWKDNKNFSFDDFVKIYGECRFNDKESGNNIQQLANVIEYNNKLVAIKERYQKSQSCINFYNENKDAFKECIISSDDRECRKQDILLNRIEKEINIGTSGQCTFTVASSKYAVSSSTRDEKRRYDIENIIHAINRAYTLKDTFLQNVKNTPIEICSTTGNVCGDMIDLGVLVKKEYLYKIPVDPQKVTTNGSGYYLNWIREDKWWLKISAPLAETDKRNYLSLTLSAAQSVVMSNVEQESTIIKNTQTNKVSQKNQTSQKINTTPTNKDATSLLVPVDILAIEEGSCVLQKSQYITFCNVDVTIDSKKNDQSKNLLLLTAPKSLQYEQVMWTIHNPKKVPIDEVVLYGPADNQVIFDSGEPKIEPVTHIASRSISKEDSTSTVNMLLKESKHVVKSLQVKQHNLPFFLTFTNN